MFRRYESISVSICGVCGVLGAMACGAPAQPATDPTDSTLSVPSSEAAPKAPSSARLAPLFGGSKKPTLFEPAARLTLWMPLAQAKQAAPALFGTAKYRPTGFTDVELSAKADAYERLGGLVMVLPRATALGDVMAMWGTPTKGYDKYAKSAVYWWFSPAAQLRARLEDNSDDPGTSRLVFSRYFPTADFLGRDADRFGFEKVPLLGVSTETYAPFSDYFPPPRGGLDGPGPYDLCRDQILILPPLEYDDAFTRIRVQCAGQRVSSYEIKIRYGAYFAHKDTIVGLLRSKFGEPTEKKGFMGRMGLEFPESTLRVRFEDSDKIKEVTIEVRRGRGTPPPEPK